MKRFILGLALTALLTVPAYSMEKMSTSDMNNVTGQAGVTIGLDHLQIKTTDGKSAWGDQDGGIIVMDKTGSTDIMNITGKIKIDAGTATDDIKDTVKDANGNDTAGDVTLVAKDTSYIKITPVDLTIDKTGSNAKTTISLTSYSGNFDLAGYAPADNSKILGTSYSTGQNTSISAKAIYIYAH